MIWRLSGENLIYETTNYSAFATVVLILHGIELWISEYVPLQCSMQFEVRKNSFKSSIEKISKTKISLQSTVEWWP